MGFVHKKQINNSKFAFSDLSRPLDTTLTPSTLGRFCGKVHLARASERFHNLRRECFPRRSSPLPMDNYYSSSGRTSVTAVAQPPSHIVELAIRPFTPFNFWDGPREAKAEQSGLEPLSHDDIQAQNRFDLIVTEVEMPNDLNITSTMPSQPANRIRGADAARPQSMCIATGRSSVASKISPPSSESSRRSWQGSDYLSTVSSLSTGSTLENSKRSSTSETLNSSLHDSVKADTTLRIAEDGSSKRNSVVMRSDVRLDHWLHNTPHSSCVDCHVESLLDKVERSFDFDWDLEDGSASSNGKLPLGTTRDGQESGPSTQKAQDLSKSYYETYQLPSIPELENTEVSAEEKKVRKLALRQTLRIDTSVGPRYMHGCFQPKPSSQQPPYKEYTLYNAQNQAPTPPVYRAYHPSLDTKTAANVDLNPNRPTSNITSELMIGPGNPRPHRGSEEHSRFVSKLTRWQHGPATHKARGSRFRQEADHNETSAPYVPLASTFQPVANIEKPLPQDVSSNSFFDGILQSIASEKSTNGPHPGADIGGESQCIDTARKLDLTSTYAAYESTHAEEMSYRSNGIPLPRNWGTSFFPFSKKK